MINPLDFVSDEEVEALREDIKHKKGGNRMIAQLGGQERMLASKADIVIGGGSRGGGKTRALLFHPCYDIYNNHFRGIIFRKGLDDLSDMIDESYEVYNDFGEFNRAKNDLTWHYANGGWMKFSYHDGSVEDFKIRFQGKQYSFIGIDEITHIEYAKFKYLITCNRNAYGLPNRFLGTCNPDPDSWVARFIDWWIGEDGLPIPERAGVVRYCFMRSDDPTDIVWGDSKKEVFEKVEGEIMKHWQKDFEQYGNPEDLFIKSVAFVPAKLADNKALMNSDPTYLANLVNQSEEQRAKDLDGNWKFKASGDDIIKYYHMERFFNNSQQLSDGTRYVSCDAALDGGDQCTMWLWIGNHIADFFSCMVDGKQLVMNIKAQLERWGVREENFTYDKNGIGKYLEGFFKKATPFNNKAAVEPKFNGIFFNLKAQAFQSLADGIINGEISIEPSILDRRISGKGYKNATIRDRMMAERKVVRFRDDDPTRLIDKPQMKRLLAGASPDLIEGLAMQRIFVIRRRRHKPHGLGFL